MKSDNSRLIAASAAAVLVLALGLISVFSYRCGWQWMDSDHSSEMILGKLLAKENALVSANWLYSTELRLFYQTIFTMPLFKLLGHFENWALIRSINIVLNNLVLVASYIFLMKQLRLQIKWILISGLFLIMPLSMEYWDIVTFGGFYIFFIAQIFCCLGLFTALTRKDNTAKTTRVYFILFTLSSFLLGIYGIRSLFAFYVPLLLTCIYLRPEKKKLPLFPGSYGFIACCAGYAVNVLLHFKYTFAVYESMRIENLFANLFPKLGRSLAYLAGFFGLSAGEPFFSARGFFSIAAIIGTFALLRTVFKIFGRVRQHDTSKTEQGHQFMPVFFAISVVFNIFVFIIVTRAITERFFIPFMIFYIPLTAILFEHAEKTYGRQQRIAIICGIILFIIGQGCLNFHSMIARDYNTGRKGYIQYLADNELNYGFATYWHANVTTELTNGRIEIAGLDPGFSSGYGRQFRFTDSLMPVNFFDRFYHQGESFLLLTSTEWDMARGRASFSGRTPDYEDEHFVIFRYPSAEIIHREILEIN